MGNQEFISQTNHNADSVRPEYRFKFVDDLTTLEVIKLLSVGLNSYNFKQHVQYDVPTYGFFVDNKNLNSQNYLDKINQWTINQKMLIYTRKTKAMLIKFTPKPFTTRLQLEDKQIEIADEWKILGTTINKKLCWNTNTKNIVQKVNKRMLVIKKIQGFGASAEEMVNIWKTYCRSILEQSAVVWGPSIMEEN